MDYGHFYIVHLASATLNVHVNWMSLMLILHDIYNGSIVFVFLTYQMTENLSCEQDSLPFKIKLTVKCLLCNICWHVVLE